MNEEALFEEILIETNTFSLNIRRAETEGFSQKNISVRWNIGKGEQHISIEAYAENGFYQFLNKEILNRSPNFSLAGVQTLVWQEFGRSQRFIVE